MELIHHMLIENEHICLNICEDLSVWCEAEERDLSKLQTVDAAVMVFARRKSMILSPLIFPGRLTRTNHSHIHLYESN